MINFMQNAYNAGLSHELALRRSLMIVILVIFGSAIVMWFFNCIGWKEVNYVPFFLGMLLLIGKGASPVALGAAILTGGTASAAQLQNPLTGAAAGLKYWIITGLPAAITFWLCLTLSLATWSFENNPGAFFPAAAAGLLIMWALITWKKLEGDTLFKIVLYYSIIVLVLALASTTRPGIWVGSQLAGVSDTFCTTDSTLTDCVEARVKAEVAAEAVRAKQRADALHEAELEAIRNPPPPAVLTTADYDKDEFGSFETIVLGPTDRPIGPITSYQGSCIGWKIDRGAEYFRVATRAAYEGRPQVATLKKTATGKLVIDKYGHAGAPWQYFFLADGGEVKLTLYRKEGADSC